MAELEERGDALVHAVGLGGDIAEDLALLVTGGAALGKLGRGADRSGPA